MVTAQPLIALTDVRAGALWFEEVLGVTRGHDDGAYQMLMDGDTMVAQLHHWDVHEHPLLGDPENPSRGNGVLLWFFVNDFPAAVNRLTAYNAEVLQEPALNENSGLHEVWLRGPEGYVVVISGHL